MKRLHLRSHTYLFALGLWSSALLGAAGCNENEPGGDAADTDGAEASATSQGSGDPTAGAGASTTPESTVTAADETSSGTASSDTTGAAECELIVPNPVECIPPESGTTTGETTSTTDGGTDTGGSVFIEQPDPVESIECNPFSQDCPAGEKCMPWANDGGNSWNALHCTPVDPRPRQVGETCTVEGSGVSGIDNCDVGAMCWNVDTETNEGTCIELCGCSAETPSCDTPETICSISNEGVLPLCISMCNPLDANPCAEGEGCYPSGETFVCVPDASREGGAQSDACESVNDCDPGFVCSTAATVPGCTSGSCCTAVCDLTAEAPCGEGLECTAFYEDEPAPACLENTGLCAGA